MGAFGDPALQDALLGLGQLGTASGGGMTSTWSVVVMRLTSSLSAGLPGTKTFFASAESRSSRRNLALRLALVRPVALEAGLGDDRPAYAVVGQRIRVRRGGRRRREANAEQDDDATRTVMTACVMASSPGAGHTGWPARADAGGCVMAEPSWDRWTSCTGLLQPGPARWPWAGRIPGPGSPGWDLPRAHPAAVAGAGASGGMQVIRAQHWRK